MKNLALKLMGLLSVALAVALLAPQRAAADDDDPPGRIARLSYTHGAVSFEPAGTDDWVSAVVNRPMTTGDKLWSDNGARAELHIGSAAIRLSDNTGFSFLNLTDNTVQLQLTAGTLNIRVRRLDDDETFEVDTPNLAFSVLRPGTYRLNVNEAGDATVVVVRDGQGEATGGGSAYAIHPHEIGTFSGTDQLDSDIENYGNDQDDDFDQWSNDRDRRFDHSVSSRYVSDDVVGYEDLDDYGGWRPVPEYGNVWFPHTTVVGWAPYRYGHWVWIGPWGWTWVEDEPWGFAPFHYGRWVAVGGVWGWVPCPPRPVVVTAVYVRPVYAPALVAWVGGPHWGVGVGFGGGGGGVAWFPLGPREVYVPSYHVSPTYVTNVNISNTTVNKTYVTNVYNTTVVNNNTTVVNNNVNVTNIKYVNQTVPGAVTATSHAAFTSAQPVARNMVKVDQKEIASAPVSTAATPNVVPQKQAVLGAGATATVKPPARLESRAVVAKTAPPPPPPSFEKQESAIKANGGKPLAISETRQLQAQTQSAKATTPVKIAPPASAATPQNTGANRTTQQQNAQQQNVQQQNNNRPPAQNNPPQNTNTTPPANQNKPGYQPANVNSKNYNDRPPSSRSVNPNVNNTTSNSNSQLEQKHQQELENLRNKQDQERQKIEQQQYQQQQKLQQQQADEKRREALNQQHQQQLEQVERKHDQEQQQLQQKQQQERQKAQQKQEQSKPPKDAKEKPKPR